MKGTVGLKLSAVVGVLSFLGAGAANAADVTKYKSNGSTASSNSNDGVYALDLSVSRNEATGSPATTNFYFNRSTCDGNGCNGTFGYGTIPNGDFTATANSAKLNTNMATNSGYQMFSFHQDFNTGEYTQTQIANAGVIVIDWKQVPRSSTRFIGISTSKQGTLTTIIAGNTYNTRATVTGSFIGQPILNSVANLGSNTNANVTIIRE